MGQEVVQFRHAEKENIENGTGGVQCHAIVCSEMEINYRKMHY
jgi:hypothetical protein